MKSGRGVFWPAVRSRIWRKATDLFMADQAKLDNYNLPEKSELVEGGYYHTAKTLNLREISQGN
jgi:hypothetical protein